MKTIRILIVDDHQIVRDGLRLLLGAQPDMEVVGEAGNGREALEMIPRLDADLVIMDLSMPEMDGLRATQAIRDSHPGIKVLVLTTYEDRGVFVRICQAGASGYVVKRVAGAELVQSIRKIAAGQLHFDEGLAGRTLAELARGSGDLKNAGDRPAKNLSEREEQVLRGIAWGYTNKELAQQLGLSVKTVETHKVRICDKLGLRSRADMVRYAMSRGWMMENRSLPQLLN